MATLRGFQVLLQELILPDDHKWEYKVKGLPQPHTLDSKHLVKAVSFVSSLSKQAVRLRIEALPANRVTQSEPGHRFLLLNFADFKLRQPAKSEDGQVQLASARDSGEYVTRLLKTGIILNDVHYHFFGHSNSQLKSRSCFMIAYPKTEIAAKIDSLGDFSKMKSVGKKVKRLGLLFSSAEVATSLDPDRCQDIADIAYDDYTFTDGCGLICTQFAKQVVQYRNISYRNKRYLPSVFQIRYRGYKGVLMLNNKMGKQIQVQFRESMKKLKNVKDLSFAVVECSKPYTFGFLNDEVVLLLHALGIPSATLLRKQAEYLQFLRDAADGVFRTAFQFLCYLDEFALANKLLIDGIEVVQPTIRSLVRQEHAKMLNKRDEQRCRIMIPQSRLLFGVCDPSDANGIAFKLKAGSCFVRITNDGDGEARTLINTDVLVTRNPCLHPGDLQKFKAVEVPEFSHLVDCIVFPTQGKRPSADLMSGGDLDGDKFFVTWDPDVVPSTLANAAAYPGVKERISVDKITDDARAEFFAMYNNMSLGRVKNLYLKWARLKGPMSAECQQLNRLFSQCVDGNRIKVPATLEDPPEVTAENEPFILDVLHQAAASTVSKSVDRDSTLSGYPGDVLDILSCRDRLAVSEFELIQLVLERCQRHDCAFRDYAGFFNYSVLSDEQQAWLLSRLPPTKDMPSLVRNGLLQSDLVTSAELRKFRLDIPRLHWKPVFRSSDDHMGRFLQSASRALELFHKKLIIFQANERLTVMVYIPRQITKAAEVEVDASVRVFALPQSSGYDAGAYKVMPTTAKYRLYCDDNAFQLYRTKRQNTFIYLARGPVDRSTYQNLKSLGDQRRQKQNTLDDGTNFDCRASIALEKISAAVQRHVGRMNRAGVLAAEIYVISNRDVQSMKVLDQWLHYIDTQEVLPLFETVEQEYRVHTIDDIGRDSIPESVAKVVCDLDMSRLKALKLPQEVSQVLMLLNQANQKSQLRAVYVGLLGIATNHQSGIDSVVVLRTLLDFLPSAPFLVEHLLESELWKSTKPSVKEETDAVFQPVLRELVLSTYQLRAFVKQPFMLLLREASTMSMQQMAELIELIALVVDEPEFALDLLLESLEPESSRLLIGRPLEIERFVKQLLGVAMDHIDEANESRSFGMQPLSLQCDSVKDGHYVLKANFRIDAPQAAFKTGDHIHFKSSSPPQNAPFQAPYCMDALVMSSEQGAATFRALHQPPPYLAECTWKYRHCGSFVTSKATFDAVTTFYTGKVGSCGLYHPLVGLRQDEVESEPDQRVYSDPTLNTSQDRALNAAMNNKLLFLWGPPGTGKTHTIAVILESMLGEFRKSRFLVTAPTHNAVDNLMQRYLDNAGSEAQKYQPLRVSTNLGKVSSSLQKYTCDAMVGKDLSESMSSRRKALSRVKESRLVFTTCVGAGLGLLRSEDFDVVFVDEASQQTEPATLIPLVKGCHRAVLVGDHVQLRATVKKHGELIGFDISMFERHYSMPESPLVAKVMLDMQYRMHSSICKFSSAEFYDSRLQTADGIDDRTIVPSQFPWPGGNSRMVFVQCSTTEDLGRQSKSNKGQVELCRKVCKLLSGTAAESDSSGEVKNKVATDIAILTPYTQQRGLLKQAITSYPVSSIDGYQGREADIIILVTVRSNVHHEIGFLKDLRRLNVAITRARAGVIIIGDRETLTGQASDDDDARSKSVWKRLLDQCVSVRVDADA